MMAEADWRAVAAESRSCDPRRGEQHDGTASRSRPLFVITNHTFLADEDVTGGPLLRLLHTIKIDDYPFGRPMEIEAALEATISTATFSGSWKCEDGQHVPTTFDGSPPELLDSDCNAAHGQDRRHDRSARHGWQTVRATVEESVHGATTRPCSRSARTDATGSRKLPLTAGEAQAARRYTDAVFGKDNASRGLRDGRSLRSLRLAAESARQHDARNRWTNSSSKIPPSAHYKGLPLKEARVRVAREYTKWTWMLSSRTRLQGSAGHGPQMKRCRRWATRSRPRWQASLHVC